MSVWFGLEVGKKFRICRGKGFEFLHHGIKMGAHGIGGGVGVALLNFIKDGLMFLQGEFLPAPAN